MVSCKIFSEDAHGREFFKRLVEKLKRQGVISSNISVNVNRLPGICYTKTKRVLKAASDFDRIIILVDADNPANKNTIFQKVSKHIPQDVANKTQVIVIDYEIEEWICQSLGINFGNQKPSEALDIWCRITKGIKKGYKKSRIVQFVDDVANSANTLMQISRTFRDFINFLSK